LLSRYASDGLGQRLCAADYESGKLFHRQPSLHRAAVHDYAFPSVSFAAPSAWTLVELPLATFTQPNWGQKLDPSWTDTNAIAFQPSAEFDDQDYDLWIDDLELVRRKRL